MQRQAAVRAADDAEPSQRGEREHGPKWRPRERGGHGTPHTNARPGGRALGPSTTSRARPRSRLLLPSFLPQETSTLNVAGTTWIRTPQPR